MSIGLCEESLQWCHDHYRVVYSSIQHLKRVHLQHVQRTKTPKQKKNVGFWDRVWGSPPSEAVHAPHEHHLLGDIGFYDEDDTTTASSSLSSLDVDVNMQSYVNMKRAIRDSLVSGFFHKPHFIPARNNNLTLPELIKYLDGNFPSIREHVYQIDAYSQTTNTDQLLCCELLYSGIHEHGTDCHGMTEGMLILAMQQQASKYQWACLGQVLQLAASSNNVLANDGSEKGVNILQQYSLESLDIIHDLVGKGLIENCFLLISGAIKEASRYMNIMVTQDPKLGTLLLEACLDLVNACVDFLQEYFLAFHGTGRELKSLVSLVPHTYIAMLCSNIQGGGTGNNVNGNVKPSTRATSPWYPNTAEIACLIGIDEFDVSSKFACNLKAKLSLLIALVLHPNLDRFQPLIHGAKSRRNQLLWQQMGVPPVIEGAKVNGDLDRVFEFIVAGIYMRNVGKTVSMLNNGIACKLSLLLLKNTPKNRRDVVCRILSSIFDNWLTDADANARDSTSLFVGVEVIGCISKEFDADKLSSSSVWHDLVDYEIKWRQQHETNCRRAYCKGGIPDGGDLYRDGGKILIDLLRLFAELGHHFKCAFAVWRSACEVYKFTIPSNVTRLFKYDGFVNGNYMGPDANLFDAKTLERLITPSDNFSWWDRNSALLEIANHAASSANVLIETYPLFLTEILKFGLYLATLPMSTSTDPYEHVNAKDSRQPRRDNRCKVGYLLTHEAFRDLRLPFLLQRIVYQLAKCSNGDYDGLFTSIYKRILARDDQIETAAATFEIVSKISGNNVDSVDENIKRLYTFPLVSGPLQVRAALTVLGLGGTCPFGLLETAQAIFELIATCDAITPAIEKSPGVPLAVADDVSRLNITLEKGQFNANVVFSILHGRFQPGMESMSASLLHALASRHIIATASATNVLDTLSDLLLQQPACGDSNLDVVTILGRGLKSFSVEECKALCSAVNSLLLSMSRKNRFKICAKDWLLNLTRALLALLPLAHLDKKPLGRILDTGVPNEPTGIQTTTTSAASATTDAQNPEGLSLDLCHELFRLLATVAGGPLAPKQGQSHATVYLLEQCLAPSNIILKHVILAVPTLPAALELLHILLKRDAILLTLNNCNLPNVPVCPCCNLETRTSDNTYTVRAKSRLHSNGFFGSSWLSNKMRNINGILSSTAHASNKHSANEAAVHDRTMNICTCLTTYKGNHVSLQHAHEAILLTLTKSNPGASSILQFDFGSIHANYSLLCGNVFHKGESCTVYKAVDVRANSEYISRAITVILQMLTRLGSRCLALFSGSLFKQLIGVYLTDESFIENRSNLDYEEMDAEDLLLCNTLEARYKTSLQRLDLSHFYNSKLSHIMYYSCDVLVLQLLAKAVDSSAHIIELSHISTLLGDEEACLVALINMARQGDLWRFNDYKHLAALAVLSKFAKVPHISKRVLDLWPDVANVHDVLMQPSHMSTLPFDALILYVQKLAFTLQLILNSSEHGNDVILDLDSLVKFYGQLTKVFCDATANLNVQLLQDWKQEMFEYPKDASCQRFLTLWKRCRVLVDAVVLNVSFATCCLDLEAVSQLDPSLVTFCSRQNRNNWFFTSIVALIHVICRIVHNALHFAATNVNIAEKVCNWLEFANVEFDPLHTSELRLCLYLVLVTTLTGLWRQCLKTVKDKVTPYSSDVEKIAPPNLNTSLGMARANIALATIFKLFEFLMLNRHTAQIRGKVYKCLSTCLEFAGTRLAIDHLISYKVAQFRDVNFGDSPLLLDLLFADASAENQVGTGDSRVWVTCSRVGSNEDDDDGVHGCVLGNDFSHFSWAEAMELGINDMFQKQALKTANSIYSPALGCNGNPGSGVGATGGGVDYRLEALSLLVFLLEGLDTVQASYLDLEAGVLQFGNLGIISVRFLQRLIQVRLAPGSCSSLDSASNTTTDTGASVGVGDGAGNKCSTCMIYILDTCRILCAASGLQQFTVLWHSTRTSHDSICLASLFFDSQGISLAISAKNASLELVKATIGTVENILNIPSTKTRNALIHWLNRHADVLLIHLKASNNADDAADANMQLLCRMLRIHRICTLWLLAQHRSKNASLNATNALKQRNGNAIKNLRDFSLVFAELQCDFTLASSLPVVALRHLDRSLGTLANGSTSQWQCVLLILQSLLPELGAFESSQDFLLASATKNVALQRLPYVSRAFEACGKGLISEISRRRHQNRSKLMVAYDKNGSASSKLALVCAAVECAATLAIHITTLLEKPHRGSTSWLGIIDAILEACKGWGVGSRLEFGGSLGNGVPVATGINHLSPDDLEHVPFTNKESAITGPHLKSVILGMCNTLLILARLLG